MSTPVRVKRGLRSQLNSAAAASSMAAGEPYLITDEGRLAVATASNAYEAAPKLSETVRTVNGVAPDGSGNVDVGGAALTTITYNADGTVNTILEDTLLTTFTYNANKTVATEVESVSGVTQKTTTYAYDAYGRITTETVT